MRLKFNDGRVREMPFNAKLAARLIVLSQHNKADYKLELDPSRPMQEQKKQVAEVQRYVDWYRTRKAFGKDI